MPYGWVSRHSTSIVIPWTTGGDIETKYSYQPIVGTAVSHPYSLVPICFFEIKVAVGLTLTLLH